MTDDVPSWEVLLAFVGLPAVLAVLWLLPGSTDWEFSLANESLWTTDAALWTAFASSYAHISVQHLFDNLLNYWVTLFAIYPLVGLAGWRREFRLASVVYLLFAPFVVSWFSLVTLGTVSNSTSLGFSGITAAFLGFLLVVLVSALSATTDEYVRQTWSAVPFLGSLALVFAVPSVHYFPVRPDVATIFGVVAVATGGLLWWQDDPTGARRRLGRLAPDHELAMLIGATVFVFGLVGALFVVRVGTNVWGHLGGYAFGFVVPYVAFVLLPAGFRLRHGR